MVEMLVCCRGLDLTYDGVLLRNSTLFLKNVVAKGSVPNSAGKVSGVSTLCGTFMIYESMDFTHICMCVWGGRAMHAPPCVLQCMISLHASVYVVVQNFNLDVNIEGMHEMQSMKIRLMPGKVVSFGGGVGAHLFPQRYFYSTI